VKNKLTVQRKIFGKKIGDPPRSDRSNQRESSEQRSAAAAVAAASLSTYEDVLPPWELLSQDGRQAAH